MKLPPTLSNQLLSFLFKDKAGLIKHLKKIYDSPVSFSDADPEMIKLCDTNNSLHIPNSIRDETKFTFLVEDILSSGKTYTPNSFVVTHGVLEHFSTEDVRSIIEGYNGNDLVRGHIHYVPTDKYTTPSFGDERLCSVEGWVDLVNPSRYIVDNCGKDLYLITEKY